MTIGAHLQHKPSLYQPLGLRSARPFGPLLSLTIRKEFL